MVWAIALLFAAAVVLLILSYSKNNQQSKSFEKQLEETTFTYMEEINKLQEQIRNLELDSEIIAVQAGLLNGSGQRILHREILDLYKRGYSAESIALKKQLSVDEIEQLLSPFKQLSNDEGSNVTHDI
jgi:hypothetical protein